MIENTFRTFRMILGCILVIIGVLFASSRSYIHPISILMQMNAIKVTENEFWHYNVLKVRQNSLKNMLRAIQMRSNCNLLQLQMLFGS